MNRRNFTTTKKHPNRITHYVKIANGTGEADVMEAELFMTKGGLTQPWGKAYRAVRANSFERAVEMATTMMRAVS